LAGLALVQCGGDQKSRLPLKATELYRWTARETRWKRYMVSRGSLGLLLLCIEISNRYLQHRCRWYNNSWGDCDIRARYRGLNSSVS